MFELSFYPIICPQKDSPFLYVITENWQQSELV